jgi:hypothetical protein
MVKVRNDGAVNNGANGGQSLTNCIDSPAMITLACRDA